MVEIQAELAGREAALEDEHEHLGRPPRRGQ
jgi:hypothetical protein